jgi:hypothetical protein
VADPADRLEDVVARMTALRKFNAKRDHNEASIVRVFQDMDCMVFRLDRPVDLLVYVWKSMSERLLLVEVKTAKGDLNDKQKAFVEAGWPVHVVRSEDDAINLVKRLRGA